MIFESNFVENEPTHKTGIGNIGDYLLLAAGKQDQKSNVAVDTFLLQTKEVLSISNYFELPREFESENFQPVINRSNNHL